MEQKQLNKAFMKRHPLMKISAYSITAATIENDMFERVSAEAIPKMFSEYERFLQIDDEKNRYSQAPLVALHNLYYRFCAK